MFQAIQADHPVTPAQAALDAPIIDTDVHPAVFDDAGERQLASALLPLAHEDADNLSLRRFLTTLFSAQVYYGIMAFEGEIQLGGGAETLAALPFQLADAGMQPANPRPLDVRALPDLLDQFSRRIRPHGAAEPIARAVPRSNAALAVIFMRFISVFAFEGGATLPLPEIITAIARGPTPEKPEEMER